MKREQVLENAKLVVTNDRNKQYGEPEDAFAIIAELWGIYLDRELSPADVAALMILMKIARVRANWRHEDSWIDIAGYAACGAEVREVG